MRRSETFPKESFDELGWQYGPTMGETHRYYLDYTTSKSPLGRGVFAKVVRRYNFLMMNEVFKGVVMPMPERSLGYVALKRTEGQDGSPTLRFSWMCPNPALGGYTREYMFIPSVEHRRRLRELLGRTAYGDPLAADFSVDNYPVRISRINFRD